ncbi:MAG: recombinase family protein [Bacteriovoracaceae bacterium]
MQIIIELWKSGKSHGAIARELNNQNIKPRKAKAWSQVVVGFIIERHQQQNKKEEK